MAREVIMPQMGLSMESGKITQWTKKSGDNVKAGEVILEVESDKATIQVEAVESGVLQIAVESDAGAVRVGTVIGYILAEGEATTRARVPAPQATRVVAPVASTLVKAGAAEQKKDGSGVRRLPSSPAARRRAGDLGVDWTLARPTGLRGQIKERDVLELSRASDQVGASPQDLQISPVARNIAESFGLNLAKLVSMFPGKRIERADVEQAIRFIIAGQQVPVPSNGLISGTPLTAQAPSAPPGQRQPMTNLRRLIADRMAQSAHATAPVTLTTEANATELVRLRETLKTDLFTKVTPSYNVLLAKLVAIALQEHPNLNATIEGNEIVSWESINVGIAVDTERGLVVPVMRNVQAKSLRQLTADAEELLGRASQGRSTPEELTGGTFTITNLGTYEIDAFTPIINLPECAVLGIGRLKRKLVVAADDTTAICTMLSLSLTFDHRLVDGAPAARFLQRVKQFVEQPYLWLTQD